ncbi:MAG: adenine phosphoribosyltransferase [Thermoleophilia bacterium]|nr:adenine phosphoribosyltransferase [Thermoleophilia bacterium]
MPGILFYDIMPLLEDPACLGACVDRIVGWARDLRVDVVAAAEARGFILGGAIAHALGVGIACARKPGKLPFQVVRREYALEYGTDVLEIHHDAIRPGQRVLIHDDLLATGGTLAATAHLVEALGGVVAGIAVVVELTGLAGRERLAGYELLSLVAYDNESVAED